MDGEILQQRIDEMHGKCGRTQCGCGAQQDGRDGEKQCLQEDAQLLLPPCGADAGQHAQITGALAQGDGKRVVDDDDRTDEDDGADGNGQQLQHGHEPGVTGHSFIQQQVAVVRDAVTAAVCTELLCMGVEGGIDLRILHIDVIGGIRCERIEPADEVKAGRSVVGHIGIIVDADDRKGAFLSFFEVFA